MEDNIPDVNTASSDSNISDIPAKKDIVTVQHTGDIQEYRDELKRIKTDATETRKAMGRIENITYLGFLIIIFMVIAILFSYIEFVYSGSKNDDYKYALSEKVSATQYELQTLKTCLASNRWLNPICFNN